MKIIARFTPQAWIKDNAVGIDPDGETEWDATEFFERGLPTLHAENYRVGLNEQMDVDGEALDAWDLFKRDPQAPEWVQLHRGPFEIHLRREDA